MTYFCPLFKSGFYIGKTHDFCLQIYCKHLASGAVFLFRIYSKSILHCHLKLNNDFFFNCCDSNLRAHLPRGFVP